MGMGKFLTQTPKGQRKIEKIGFDTGTFSLLQNMLLVIKDKLSSSLSSSSGLRTTKQHS